MFDEILKKEIKATAEEIISEKIAPLEVLKGYENVEVLTLDEVSKILRKDKQLIRDAVRRGEIPGHAVGRDVIFPKNLIAKFLLGLWSAKTKAKRKGSSDMDEKLLAFVN